MTLAIPCLFIFATLEWSVMAHPKIYTDSKYDVAQMIEEHNIKVTTIYVDDINDVGTLIMKRSFFGIDEYLAMEKILDENSDEKFKKIIRSVLWDLIIKMEKKFMKYLN